MTSISNHSSRTRAGMLIVALALVGGTGCITTAIVQDVKQQNRIREAEEARQKDIARLTPLADAGDPAAATALVRALLAFRKPVPVDQARVFALLSGAAGKNYGPAQALLGDILISGHFQTVYPQVNVEPRFQDRERGFELLRRAASQACTFTRSPGAEYYYYGAIRPAAQLSAQLGRNGHGDEARVWTARSVMHCGEPSAQNLAWRITPKNATPQQRTEALALMLLTQDAERIAKAEVDMPGDQVAAARRDAEQLRRQVAQSEQQYPAPKRKEMQ
jgi:hypothetical protein